MRIGMLILLSLVLLMSGCGNNMIDVGTAPDPAPPSNADSVKADQKQSGSQALEAEPEAQSGQAPKEEDFEVKVKIMDETLKINKNIEVVAELTNKSGHNIKLLHASPLIQVQIYDEQNKPLINALLTNDIGIMGTLKPGAVYNPDSSAFNGGKRLIKIDTPGNYKLVGTASFSVELSGGERKDFKLSSEPFEFNIQCTPGSC
ncbi:hypothetical protein ACFOLF_16095 [Paenibacillus sepulcri]|uniref:DUF4352 domain-containing protein n=1 Tax=Paenibacillus sepulcri TaxID=359917 RepID=A0ABS7CA96_9BACL|nr:hypothetical protein [Paenibacillus sepulcri]